MAGHQHVEPGQYNATTHVIPGFVDEVDDWIQYPESPHGDNSLSLLADQGCHIPDSFEGINNIDPDSLFDLSALYTGEPDFSELFSQNSNDSHAQTPGETLASIGPAAQRPDLVHPARHDSATSGLEGRFNKRRLPRLLPRPLPSRPIQYQPNLSIDTTPDKADNGLKFRPNSVIKDGKVGIPRSRKAPMKSNKKTGVFKGNTAPPKNVPASHFSSFPSKPDSLLGSSTTRKRRERGQICFGCSIFKKPCSGTPPFDIPCDECVQRSQSGAIHWKRCFESDLCNLNIIFEGLRMKEINNDFESITPNTVQMEIILSAASDLSTRDMFGAFPVPPQSVTHDDQLPIYKFWDDFFDSVHNYDFNLVELFALRYKGFSKSHLRIHAWIGMLLYLQQIKCRTGLGRFTHLRLIAGISERLFDDVKRCISHLKSGPEREDRESLLMVLNYMALLISRQQPVAAASPKYYAMVDHLKLYLGHWAAKLGEKAPKTVTKSLQEHRRQLKTFIIAAKTATVGEIDEFFPPKPFKQPLQNFRLLREELNVLQADVESRLTELGDLKTRLTEVYNPNLAKTNALAKLEIMLPRIRALSGKCVSMEAETRRVAGMDTDGNKKALQEVNTALARYYESLFERAFGGLWTGDQSSSA